ncbi:MFS transporter [Nocardioides insulae]|uniref:MFS transporter n=1 Tax=Nocardioides insulae TaxID=394734 RepID=UPI00041DC203|nr:MFS transporter [Nocardioides insulae]
MTTRSGGAPRTAWSTLVVVCLVSTLIGLNGSTLTIALPTLTRHFEATALQGSWLLLSYMVTSTACLLLVGRLSDTWGRRRLYICGLTIFTFSSVLSGLAPTVGVLIGLRVVAAIGGAILLANGATLIHAAFRQPALNTAMGLYAASFPVANLLGPTVGGAVVEWFGWQWVFWFNVPLCLVALIVGMVLLPHDHRASEDASAGVRDLDLGGNLTLIVVVVLFTTGISLVSDLHWGDPLVWGSIGLAIALVPVLLAVERRAAHPVLDLPAIRRSGLTRLYLATFFNGAARFPMVVLVSIYLQAVLEVGPTEAGIRILPLPVGSILAAMSIGSLGRRLTPHQISALGSGIGLAGGVLVMAAIGLTVTPLLPVGLLVSGIGTGLFIGTNATTMLEASPGDSLGVVNGMRLMMQNTGNVTSLALSLTLLTAGLATDLRRQVIAAVVPAGDADQVVPGFLVATGFLVVLGVVGFWFTLPRRRRRDVAEPTVPEQRSRWAPDGGADVR